MPKKNGVETAKEIFSEQIKGLVDGGVDAILIETMSDLEEVRAALAARGLALALPPPPAAAGDSSKSSISELQIEEPWAQLRQRAIDLTSALCRNILSTACPPLLT